MHVPGQFVRATLVHGSTWSAIHLDESADKLLLRFALEVREVGVHIMPALLLDDWGHEISSIRLYQWLLDNGDRFPRAEVFGYDLTGKERQHFVRELDLTIRFPCYAYALTMTEFTNGSQIEHVFISNSAATEASITAVPTTIDMPLRMARVRWWQIPVIVQEDGEVVYFDKDMLDIK